MHPANLAYFKMYIEGRVIPALVSLTMPDIVQQTEEYRASGIAGTINLPKVGHFEAMQMTIKPRSMVKEVDEGLRFNERINVEMRSSYTNHDADTGKVGALSRVINAGLILRSRTNDEVAQGREEGPEYLCDVVYYREALDGTEIWEIDPFNMVAKHRGQDLLEAHRQNIGS